MMTYLRHAVSTRAYCTPRSDGVAILEGAGQGSQIATPTKKLQTSPKTNLPIVFTQYHTTSSSKAPKISHIAIDLASSLYSAGAVSGT